MADRTIDSMLDLGAAPLQYFRIVLNVASMISAKQWPDWRDHFCRAYDNERGTDLEALRSDAAKLRKAASVARQAATDQSAARGDVDRGWPDSAGRSALVTLDAHQKLSTPIADSLEASATAADAADGAVVAAVAQKVAKLNAEFTAAETETLSQQFETMPRGMLLDAEFVANFEARLSQDVELFDSIIAEARTAIEKAYAAVPAAAKVDTSAFPAPQFDTSPGGGSTNGGTTNPGGTSPGGGGTTSPGGGGTTSPGGGSTGGAGTDGSTGGSTGGKTGTTSPSGLTTGTPTATTPTTGITPASTTPASATPSSTNPLSGLSGSSGSGGMPSWLSQLVPKIAEQLGLGKTDDKTDAKDGKDGKDEAKGKDDKNGTSGTKDAQGNTVTAKLSPDGKTVDVTVTKPDGTQEKATLKVGEDGKLTLDDAKDKPAGTVPAGATPSDKPSAGTAGAGTPGGAGTTGAGTTGAGNPGAGTTGGAANTGTPGASVGGASQGATPSASTGPDPAAVSPAPGPKSGAPQQGDQTPSAPAEEPCPPEQQGSGAELAVTVP
ncbi:hypothetical protein TTY48_09820 [Tsukamurella sp. TY48]|uniref:hypothetical protein n=1 Tax=Tsukamurella sp. TY48 TaxID=2775495 RepID=UPI001C7E0FF0|nr:hypothetical protein [Tsukamurella sp. TY48]GIZ96370.1 hypothetical protein TTY48_09820 [Tsukamurella sp. TY48]